MERSGKQVRLRRAHALVIAAVFALVVVGLALGFGWGTLCAAGMGGIVALCPLGFLETLVASKLLIPPVLVVGACSLVAAVLLGRLFCGWVCPVPPLQRFFRGKAAQEGPAAAEGTEASLVSASCGCGTPEALSPQEKGLLKGGCCSSHACGAPLPAVGGKRDGVVLDSRHAVLAGAIASSAVFGFPVFCLVCPVGLTFATLIALWRAFFVHDPSWMLLVAPLVLLLELVVFRKWCHRLCPLGALLSLLGQRAPVAKPKVDSSKCLREKGVDCRACVTACPEQLDPHSAVLAECTRCGECAQSCPAEAIRLLKRG